MPTSLMQSETRSGDKWMSGNTQMDSIGIQGLIDKLRDLSSVKFMDGALSNSLMEITVTSNDGKLTEKVLIGKQAAMHVAKRDNEAALYQVENTAVEELQRAAKDVKPHQAPAAAQKK